MILAFRARILFIGTAAFAIGILWGTLSSVPLHYLLLSEFVGFLFIILSSTVSFQIEVLDSRKAKSKIFFLVWGIVLVVFPIGEARAAQAPHGLPSAFVSLLNTSVSLTGTIIADPDIRQKNQQLIVQVSRVSENPNPEIVTQKTNILVFVPIFQRFVYGEEVHVTGMFSAPTPFVTDSGRVFRYDNFLAKKGVFAMIPQADVAEVSPPHGFWNACANFLFKAKHIFVEGLSRALPDPYAQLATGLLTGDQHGLGDTLVTTLALSGLIWVVVLSGYHVTLIAEGVLKLFGFLPRRFSFMLAGLSIIAIVFATGASAPSIRGAIMACFTLFAQVTYQKYDALRALSIALIGILLWNPFLLAYDSGFQLSVIVTPALLLAVPILEVRLLWITSKILREIITVSIVAQLACLPLILWQTGELGVWAIPANMFVMWLVPVAMFATLIAGFAGVVIPILAPIVGLPAYGILYYLLAVAKTAANLPFAAVILPPFPFFYVLAMYGIFIWILYLLAQKVPTTPLQSKIAFR